MKYTFNGPVTGFNGKGVITSNWECSVKASNLTQAKILFEKEYKKYNKSCAYCSFKDKYIIKEK